MSLANGGREDPTDGAFLIAPVSLLFSSSAPPTRGDDDDEGFFDSSMNGTRDVDAKDDVQGTNDVLVRIVPGEIVADGKDSVVEPAALV